MSILFNQEKFDEYITEFPVFEYRLIDTADIQVQKRVRDICKNECVRYGSTWACPPAVGTLEECKERIQNYDQAIFFSSVAEVSDIMNMEEMLKTRRAHEELTSSLGEFLEKEGYQIFILSTESCDLCADCAYKHNEPCRHPEYMHPCLESHGVVVQEIVEQQEMEYNLGGNTILWFSMICFRNKE
ncbi:MAG: DUF2284 domain-containing protein [Eubacteriales bacterium]|nr:DUF2284 domain-containing protein [Eubacteriales bacterium]